MSGELILCTMRLRQSKLDPLIGELKPEIQQAKLNSETYLIELLFYL